MKAPSSSLRRKPFGLELRAERPESRTYWKDWIPRQCGISKILRPATVYPGLRSGTE